MRLNKLNKWVFFINYKLILEFNDIESGANDSGLYFVIYEVVYA